MLNVVESRVVARTWREWEPQIIYVQHQTAPFPTRIWLPPFAEPIAPRVPGAHVAPGEHHRHDHRAGARVERPGGRDAHGHRVRRLVSRLHRLHADAAEHQRVLDGDGALSLCNAALLHDRRFSRATCATCGRSRSTRARGRAAGGGSRTPSTTCGRRPIATLDYATKYREELLYNRYQAGRNAIKRYAAEPPYAYVIPQTQRDPGTAAEMLRRLAFNGVRVGQLDRDVDDRRRDAAVAAAGSFRWTRNSRSSLGSCSRRRSIRTCASIPRARRSSRTTPRAGRCRIQMDVNVIEVRSPLSADARAAIQPVRGKPTDWRASADAPFSTDSIAAGIVAPPGAITGSGDRLAVDPAQNDAFRLITQALAAGGAVRAVPGARGQGARYVVSGVPDGAPRRMGARALAARGACLVRRGRRTGRAAADRASSSPGPRAWTRAGPSGCSISTASSTR